MVFTPNPPSIFCDMADSLRLIHPTLLNSNINLMNIFEDVAVEYDEWFETHKWVYQSEVEAARRLIPET